MAKVNLVTVLFKSDNVLEGFLKSIANQSFKDYHLTLVDNTTNDTTNELLSDLLNKYHITAVTHIKNLDNPGVAKGNNQGIEASLRLGSKYTLLLNNDIEFGQTDVFQKLFDTAEARNEKFIIPKIFYYDTKKIWVAGGKIDDYRGIAVHIGQNEDDNEIYNLAGYYDYAPTCFMLIETIVFHTVGLMDERYFVYYDDADFIYRANKCGYKLYYMPELNIYHKVSSSTGGEESLFTIYYFNRNRVYFILKNLSYFKKTSAIIYTIMTRIIKYIKYNKVQRNNLCKGIIDGFKMYRLN